MPARRPRCATLLARASLAAALAATAGLGCSDSTAPAPLVAPPFVFVSDAEGTLGIFRADAGTVARLSAAGHDDREPHSADGRIVFTSRRDGNPEIYIAALDLTNAVRLTTTSATDTRPALNPAGTTVAFVSSRSGAPRVWLMDADGSNPRALNTGSLTFVPEGSPSWSPAGGHIAFTSTRTNTSQVFVMPAAGGEAIQLSRESGGAFTPVWSADGRFVHYMALAGGHRLVSVPSGGGDPRSFAEDEMGLSELTCGGSICLATVGPLDAAGDLIILSRDGRRRAVALERAANDRQAAILVQP